MSNKNGIDSAARTARLRPATPHRKPYRRETVPCDCGGALGAAFNCGLHGLGLEGARCTCQDTLEPVVVTGPARVGELIKENARCLAVKPSRTPGWDVVLALVDTGARLHPIEFVVWNRCVDTGECQSGRYFNDMTVGALKSAVKCFEKAN